MLFFLRFINYRLSIGCHRFINIQAEVPKVRNVNHLGISGEKCMLGGKPFISLSTAQGTHPSPRFLGSHVISSFYSSKLVLTVSEKILQFQSQKNGIRELKGTQTNSTQTTHNKTNKHRQIITRHVSRLFRGQCTLILYIRENILSIKYLNLQLIVNFNYYSQAY